MLAKSAYAVKLNFHSPSRPRIKEIENARRRQSYDFEKYFHVPAANSQRFALPSRFKREALGFGFEIYLNIKTDGKQER